MTTTREQLELAAKALDRPYGVADDGAIFFDGKEWMPHTDSGDSFRLMCDLEIDTLFSEEFAECNDGRTIIRAVKHNNTPEDRRRAVREAVLAVAAEIGRSMK